VIPTRPDAAGAGHAMTFASDLSVDVDRLEQ